MRRYRRAWLSLHLAVRRASNTGDRLGHLACVCAHSGLSATRRNAGVSAVNESARPQTAPARGHRVSAGGHRVSARGHPVKVRGDLGQRRHQLAAVVCSGAALASDVGPLYPTSWGRTEATRPGRESSERLRGGDCHGSQLRPSRRRLSTGAVNGDHRRGLLRSTAPVCKQQHSMIHRPVMPNVKTQRIRLTFSSILVINSRFHASFFT